ncbi:MAG: leucine-rich repeat domain-containing protein [Clostridiales bacterium]|nr:leucine-rich repeat domain-containing protein [Clostridiales bacterium]
MKRFIAVVAVVGIVLGLAACGKAPEKAVNRGSDAKAGIAVEANEGDHYYKYFVVKNGIFKMDTEKYTKEEIREGAKGEIIIPEGVTGVGNFIECKNVTKVVIPEGVTELPWGCFQKCEALEEVVLPEGLTTFKGATFNECKNLHKVVLPKSFKNFKGLGADFYKCGEIAVYFPAEVELESWTKDKDNKGLTNMPINTFKNITLYIVKDSWMDKHFEELYDDASSATKLAKKNGEKRKDIPPVAYWEG